MIGNKVMQGIIFDIKRFAIHDGDGMRTTVFLKGCPLKCIWCHNPEGIDFKSQIAYYKEKCIGCAECVSVCPNNAHIIAKNGHIFEKIPVLLAANAPMFALEMLCCFTEKV